MVWTIKRRKRTSTKTVLALVGYAPDCANQCMPCESHDLAQSVFYLHTPKEIFMGRKDEIHWERVKRLPLGAMRDWQRKVGLNIFEIINRKKKPSAFLTKQTKTKKQWQQRMVSQNFWPLGLFQIYNTHDLYDNVFILTHFQGLSVKLPWLIIIIIILPNQKLVAYRKIT